MSVAASSPPKIALFQGESKIGDVPHNLSKMKKQMETAKQSGAALIIFPELFLTGYTLASEDMKRLAEDKQGSSFKQLSAAAKHLDIAVLYGYPEVDTSSETPVYYNSAQLIDRDGSSLINHHKTHLWIDSDGYEKVFAPGKELSGVVECCGMKIGVLICFEVEFPETVRVLALRGANVVLVVAASLAEYSGCYIDTKIVPVRAIENRVYIARVSMCGSVFCGRSACYNPLGETTVSAQAEEEMLLATVDLQIKTPFDYIKFRRPSLYTEYHKEYHSLV